MKLFNLTSFSLKSFLRLSSTLFILCGLCSLPLTNSKNEEDNSCRDINYSAPAMIDSKGVALGNNIFIVPTNFGACNDNGTPDDPNDDFFTADIMILVSGAGNVPTTGTLNLSGDFNGSSISVPVSAIVNNVYTFTAVEFSADWLDKIVNASFSVDPNCIATNTVNGMPSCGGLYEQECELLDPHGFKTVLVNFHIMQFSENDPRNFENTCDHLEYLTLLINSANAETWDNAGQEEWCDGEPMGSETAMCDTKIHLELNLIEFHVDAGAWANYGMPLVSNSGLDDNFIKSNGALLPEYANAMNIFFVEEGVCGSGNIGGCGAGFMESQNGNGSDGPYAILNRQFTNYLDQVGSSNWDVEAASGMLNHEIGHALSLPHIWQNPNITHNCPDGQSTQWVAGSNMMMGYTYNKRYITVEELQSVHTDLESGIAAGFVDNSFCDDYYFYASNNNTDINTIDIDEARRFCGQVYIEDGAIVTVKGSIFMHRTKTDFLGQEDKPYKYIHVKPGGKLILDGGIIMSDAGWYFGGILMTGTSEVEIMNHGKILSARTGIWKKEWQDVAKGKITIDEAIFKNCRTGIYFENNQLCTEQSSIKRAHFYDEVDQSDRGIFFRRSDDVLVEDCHFDGQRRQGILAFQSTNIGILGSLFENIEEFNYSSGIRADDSHILVEGNNEFANVNRGIDIESDGGNALDQGINIGPGILSGSGNNIRANLFGIHVESNRTNTPLTIAYNLIYGSRRGVFIDGVSNYDIAENYFGSHDKEAVRVTSTNSQQAADFQLIRNNYFNTLSPGETPVGIQSIGDNSILKIEGNCFRSTETDISILYGAGIESPQGSPNGSAENCFTNDGVTAIDNQGWNLTYYDIQNSPSNLCSTPLIVNNVTVTGAPNINLNECLLVLQDPDPKDEFCDCDILFLTDKSRSMDERELEEMECSIQQTISDIQKHCEDECSSRFASASFGDDPRDLVIDNEFSCDSIRSIGTNTEGGTNLATGLVGILEWFESGAGSGDGRDDDGEFEDEGDTTGDDGDGTGDDSEEDDYNPDCLKIILYTDGNCEDFNDYTSLDGDRLSVNSLIDSLEQNYGAEVSIVHFNNYDRDENLINSLENCKDANLAVTDTTGVLVESDFECEGLSALLADEEETEENAEGRSADYLHLDNGSENVITSFDKNRNDHQNEVAIVYPNPFRNVLNLDVVKNANYKIEVSNNLSIAVYKEIIEIENQKHSINTSQWPSGIYYIKCTDLDNDKTTVKKVILARG